MNTKTYYHAKIEVRNYSEQNKTVLNPENAEKIVLDIGDFARPSQAEKFRKRLAENNHTFTFLLTIKENVDYESTETTNL